MSTTPYLRLHQLEKVSNIDDINRLSDVWDYWQTIVNYPPNLHLINKASLCTRLDNDTLEWTKKIAFSQVLSIYKETHPTTITQH